MFGEDVFVLPLGLDTKKGVAKLVFSDTAATINWTEKELKKVSDFMWEQKQKDPLPEFYFDFRELEHVYQLLLAQEDLEAELAAIGDFDNSLRPLLDTLEFYAAAAHLDPIHREILDMKVRKVRNEEVAAAVNGKYGKSYTPNYISTIFRHKIIKEINEAAKHHLEIMENVFFPENFRYCTKCGEYMLKSPHNFVRKTKSADGYTGRCKRCDKVVRANKQGGGGEKNGQ